SPPSAGTAIPSATPRGDRTMPLVKPCLLLPALLAAAAPWPAADDPAPRLDPDLPYQAERADPVTYTVELVAVVTAPQGTRTLQVWLPLPPSDPAQEVTDRTFDTFPVAVAPRVA